MRTQWRTEGGADGATAPGIQAERAVCIKKNNYGRPK